MIKLQILVRGIYQARQSKIKVVCNPPPGVIQSIRQPNAVRSARNGGDGSGAATEIGGFTLEVMRSPRTTISRVPDVRG